MVSTRPLTRRQAITSYRPDLTRLPSSHHHQQPTQTALYAVGASQFTSAIVFVYLTIAAYWKGFISTDYLFIIPFFCALLGIAMTVIGHMGSLSAPWLAVLLNLPLALSALYIDGFFVSWLLVAVLVASGWWLTRGLIDDMQLREEADDAPVGRHGTR